MKTAVRRQLDRRTFFKSAGAAAAGASAFGLLGDADLEAAVQNVNRNSIPSQLKITDLRVATVVGAPMTCPLIRIDTNQGLSGYGEVRDGASTTYALMLKSRLLGENPCNVDKIFRKIKQFGHHARQARRRLRRRDGALGPGRQGLRRARATRCWAASSATRCGSTPTRPRPRTRGSRAARLKERMEQGFTLLKMDVGDQPAAATSRVRSRKPAGCRLERP